jgi:cell wall-associated NlpC family hydrolase
MTINDVTARIQQIQGRLAALTPTQAASAGQPVGSPAAFQAALAAATATGTGGTGSTGTAGQAVVDEARRYLGVPYRWGGTDPSTGLDCSGLVQLVYSKSGISLPRVSSEQARVGQAVPSLAQAQPGDILAFGSPVHHVAIYIGHGKMIEAPHTGEDVRISDVYETPTAIRRVLPTTTTASTARVTGATATGALPAGTPYAALFQQAQARYGVPASLLAAVAHQESGYRANSVSPAGARGLMQLMPGTAAGLGVDPTNPAQAVDGAARLLRNLITEFGRTDLALAAYNAGPGAVHRYHGIPPYPETRRYVPSVLAYQSLLEQS